MSGQPSMIADLAGALTGGNDWAIRALLCGVAIETRLIDAAALLDLAGWERANGAKLLQAELVGDGTARALVLPVAAVSWYVNVWNCRADLVLVTAEGERCAEELFDLDAGALDALIDRVIYDDHGGGLNMSGRYYPLTEGSRAAFDRLMATAKPTAGE